MNDSKPPNAPKAPVEQNAHAVLPETIIHPEDLTKIKESFDAMPAVVELHLYPPAPQGPVEGEEDVYTRFAWQMMTELAAISSKLRVVRHSVAEGEALPGPKALPALEIKADGAARPVLRFGGAPIGEESRALVQVILMTGQAESALLPESRVALAKLDTERNIQVFTTATCPYCPHQVVLAAACALENPKINVYAIAADQFPALADQYKVGGVPHTVVDEDFSQVGVVPEGPFAAFLVDMDARVFAARVNEYAQNARPGAYNSEAANCDLLVLGGGPAGLSAGIYGGRAGLKVTVLEKGILGGQVALTRTVENYPGVRSASGTELAAAYAEHARQYSSVVTEVGNIRVEAVEEGFNVHTSGGVYHGKALLLATGSALRKLDVPGEERLSGRGVSYCTTCDGFLFRNKRVLVVGGGNTALTDALHLNTLGAQVTLAHRRDSFRADQVLQDAVHKAGINIIWDSALKEISGDAGVSGVTLLNLRDGKEITLELEGVFIAVGTTPNVAEARDLQLELNQDGSIKVDAAMRTTRPLVYAAGDVCGGLRQIVTAISGGAAAAISTAEDLQRMPINLVEGVA